MSHNLTIVLTSSDLYSSIAESVGVTIDSSVGVFRIGKGLVCQLVPTLKPSKARDWLFEYRKRGYKGDHVGFLDLDYETIERFSQPGWRTILYNPAGEVIQANFPAQDADILDLGTLADADKLFAGKPTLQQCFGWWEEWEVPENIRQHSSVVARAAYVLAVLLRNRGEAVDPILAHRGGMLHDIDKIQTLELTGAHGALGADFLQKQNFPELARMVKQHIMSSILDSHFDERGWENKLVFFCDKLVEGDVLVPFNERLNHLYERYPRYQEMMKKSEASVWALSEEICAVLELRDHIELIHTLQSFC